MGRFRGKPRSQEEAQPVAVPVVAEKRPQRVPVAHSPQPEAVPAAPVPVVARPGLPPGSVLPWSRIHHKS